MTLAPDRTGYHPHGEVDDAPHLTLHCEFRDWTTPLEPATGRAAEHVILRHIQEWYDTRDYDLRLAWHCATVDLGAEPPWAGFRELADEYREPMTQGEADAWTQQLTDYINDWKA